jgi:hypothetical protein
LKEKNARLRGDTLEKCTYRMCIEDPLEESKGYWRPFLVMLTELQNSVGILGKAHKKVEILWDHIQPYFQMFSSAV